MSSVSVNTLQNDDNLIIQDLEVKDALLIFNAVWSRLEDEFGRENLRFPKEIFWLNGAPGAGKGTNTEFIMKFRDLTAAPIVVSQLLESPEAKLMKDAGLLVGDREVIEIILRKLLDTNYRFGAVVDGFPRTIVQVECVKMLYNKLNELRDQYINTPLSKYFKKPHFHIVVLFVDEKESVKRQLNRGREVELNNMEVKESGMGELLELRPTDLDPEAAINRYRTFKEKTYGALKDLRKIFFYHFINAHGTIEEVRERIDLELQYQGSLELDEATYDHLSRIPLASDIAKHARQELVDRLESYVHQHNGLFNRVVELLVEEFIPRIKRNTISGLSVIKSENQIFDNDLAMDMLVDIFSERGYHAVVDINNIEVPDTIDTNSNKIVTRTKCVYTFRIHYSSSMIRRGR